MSNLSNLTRRPPESEPRSLAAWSHECGRVSRMQAVGWAIRLLKTLEPMHARGVAHGNVCAEAIRASSASPCAPADLVRADRLGQQHRYHSPERLLDGRPSTVQDVWAVGVVLYQLLTGRVPFSGRTRAEMSASLAAGPAPLSRYDVRDPELQAIVDRLFSPLNQRIVRAVALREVLERWSRHRLILLAPLSLDDSEPESGEHPILDCDPVHDSTLRLLTRLERVLTVPPSSAPPSRPARSRPRVVLITAAVILGLEALAGAIWLLWR